ncbi:MAG: glutathione S-transferase family protein [Sneathiellaceae bacterium]
MGLLVDGTWQDKWYDTRKTDGHFVRQESSFRETVGGTRFPAEAGRYHLYVSLACPWAHRALIFRRLKRLEDAISLSVVDWLMLENGWQFSTREGCIPDPVRGAAYLHEVYTTARPDYTGRVTVPVLWDKKAGTIVNNESAEIIRIFNSAFDGLGGGIGNPDLDFYPRDLRDTIDAVNERVYHAINNGVYKCGFATTQAAYEEAFAALFAALDEMEERLAAQRYLAGDRLTEADWRLFTTLVRFDPVYAGHFKCNLRRIADYPNLQNYLRELYQHPGIAGTVNMRHIKGHYYESHRTVNPAGIVPVGPVLTLDAPHDRDRLKAAA